MLALGSVPRSGVPTVDVHFQTSECNFFNQIDIKDLSMGVRKKYQRNFLAGVFGTVREDERLGRHLAVWVF